MISEELTKTVSGTPPLALSGSKGEALLSWSITGNTVQDREPTPEQPIEVKGVGDYDAETGKYKVPVVCGNKTTDIYLCSSIMDGEALDSNGNKEVKWVKRTFNGSENYTYHYDGDANGTIMFSSEILEKGVTNGSTFNSHLPSCTPPTSPWTTDYESAGRAGDSVYSDYYYFRVKLSRIGATTSDSRATKQQKFKNWIASENNKGTPVNVWYTLKTSTTEKVEVLQIPTTQGNCIIDVDTSIKPINLTAIYLLNDKEGAFQDIATLEKVSIPQSVKKIGEYAFAGTALKKVRIAVDCEYFPTSFPEGCVVEFYGQEV